jgi:hypothetical protein
LRATIAELNWSGPIMQRSRFRPSLEHLEPREVPAQLNFAVNEVVSSVTLSGSFNTPVGTMPIQQQGAGSLTTTVGGTIVVDLNGNNGTIEFLNTTDLVLANSGSWQPGIGGVAGSAAANFGATATFTIFSALAAVRGGEVTFASGPIPIGGIIDTNRITGTFTAGSADYSSNLPVSAPSSTVSLIGLFAGNSPGTTGSLNLSGSTLTLTIPVSVSYTVPIASGFSATLTIAGSLQASATVSPEITVAGLGNDVADGSAASTVNGSAFGDAAVGATRDRTFTVTNDGTDTLSLTLDAGSVTGAGFSLLSGAGSFNLPSGGTTDFVVRFAPGGPGSFTGAVSFINNDSDENPFNFSLSGNGTGFDPAVPFFVVSTGGKAPTGVNQVQAFNLDGTPRFPGFDPYSRALTGGVRVAVGDLTGDGVADIVTGPGPGVAAKVKVFDGKDGAAVGAGFFPYGTAFKQGIFVAVGNIVDDANSPGNEIVVSAAGRKVKISNNAGVLLTQFFPFGTAYKGAVRLAVCDVNGVGLDEIVVTRGGPVRVRTFGVTGLAVSQVMPQFIPAGVKGNPFVAVGNVLGSPGASIILGDGSGGQVRVFNSDGTLQQTLPAPYGTSFAKGVRVGVFDVNDDGVLDILTGPGTTGGQLAKVFQASDGTLLDLFDVFSAYDGGFFVAGSH